MGFFLEYGFLTQIQSKNPNIFYLFKIPQNFSKNWCLKGGIKFEQIPQKISQKNFAQFFSYFFVEIIYLCKRLSANFFPPLTKNLIHLFWEGPALYGNRNPAINNPSLKFDLSILKSGRFPIFISKLKDQLYESP